jgi:hypothetical protein
MPCPPKGTRGGIAANIVKLADLLQKPFQLDEQLGVFPWGRAL